MYYVVCITLVFRLMSNSVWCMKPSVLTLLMPFLSAAELCPISEDQFQVAAAEQVSIESVQESLLVSRIVVGFAIENDLKVFGISRGDLMVRDIQLCKSIV